MSGQAVNSASTRLRRLQISRLQSEGIDSPEQQTPQASESHEPMPVIASRAEPGPRSSLCSNFTTKLLSLLMLSGTAEASSGSPKKEEEEAHTLGELIRDYHHEGESWVGTTGRFLRESGIREGLDNTFETLGACAEVVTKALFGMPERGLRHVARELGFEVRTGAPRTEHSIERVKEFIGHKIRQDAEAIKPALKNVVEKYDITADELLAVRTTLEVVPIAKAGQLAQKGAGNLVRKALTKLDQRLVQTTAQPMLFSADGVAVRNLEAGLGTVSREGKSLSRTKTKGQAAAGEHALSEKGISKPVRKSAENRAKSLSSGIPIEKLGPSQLPKIHVKKHASMKKAEDAVIARSRKGAKLSKKQKKGSQQSFDVIQKHQNPVGRKDVTPDPHFHPAGSRHREHHSYPRKGYAKKSES